MKSVFKPEKSFGERFSKTSYVIVARKMKIDPIREGAQLKVTLQKLLSPMKLLKVEDRRTREKQANAMIERFGQRSRKFWRTYQQYVFLRGELRGLASLEKFDPNAEKESQRLRKELKEPQNAEGRG